MLLFENNYGKLTYHPFFYIAMYRYFEVLSVNAEGNGGFLAGANDFSAKLVSPILHSIYYQYLILIPCRR